MASQFEQRHVHWRMIAIVVGLFTLIALPIVRADAYAVTENHDLSTIAESQSIVVHTSTPGRHALHVDSTVDVSCVGCDEHNDSEITHEVAQRFAIVPPVRSIRRIATSPVLGSQDTLPGPFSLLPEFPPPQD